MRHMSTYVIKEELPALNKSHLNKPTLTASVFIGHDYGTLFQGICQGRGMTSENLLRSFKFLWFEVKAGLEGNPDVRTLVYRLEGNPGVPSE